MTRNKTYTPVEKGAQILSDIFSPIVIPSYMMAISMWMTPLVILPERPRIAAMSVIALLTAVLPLAAILTLMKLGKVHDVSLSDKKERTIPYIITISCYIGAYIYLRLIHAPLWLGDFYLGAAAASVIASLITLKWKISAHTSAVGGFAAAIIWMALNRLIIFAPLGWITGAILIVGLIASARLILKRHTLAQVFAGFLLGFLCVIITLTI